MLRQVVIDHERVAAVVEEVLPHRAAGERRHPLDRCGLLGGCGHDRRVVHRAAVTEQLVDLRDGRRLLADRDVDAFHVRVLLVQDRVDPDRRLAGLPVADDQLPLAAPDVGHRVDRLDPGEERLLHGLARDHPRSFELEQPGLGRFDRSTAVEWIPERVDDASEESLADRDACNPAGPPDRLALLHVLPFAEERGADVVLFEVEREADDSVLELEHFQRDRVLEAVGAGYPVPHLQDGSDLGEIGLDIVVLDSVLENRDDLLGTKLHRIPFMVRRMV